MTGETADKNNRAARPALARAPYVSLATFRRNGEVVATPVWCAEHDGDFFVFSAGDAGKVKRLRIGNRARLAVCDFGGTPKSDWQDATAELIDDPGEVARALRVLRGKYGWQMWLADIGAKLTGRFDKRSYIRVRLQN